VVRYKSNLGGHAPRTGYHTTSGRRLKCQDPQIVKKYNNQVDEVIQQQNILGRVAAIYQDRVVQLTKTQIVELEDIDNVLTTTKLAAEKQCQKVHAG